MSWFDAIILGVLEGITEFLPVSSTGHLTIAEKALGYKIDAADITAFTAIIQVGAVLATLIHFRRDLVRMIAALLAGLSDSSKRTGSEWRFACAWIIGSIPIGIIGLLFKDQIETTFRSLWYVAGALLVWSAVMWAVDRRAKQTRDEVQVNWKDTLIIGVAQCLALVPGVSRSGATMSAGLLRDLDRVTVTRLSFFLSIPALGAAGAMQTLTQYDTIKSGVGWGPTILATAVSFVVAYVAIAWLLSYIANHTYLAFIVYRVALGSVLLVLLATGALSAR